MPFAHEEVHVYEIKAMFQVSFKKNPKELSRSTKRLFAFGNLKTELSQTSVFFPRSGPLVNLGLTNENVVILVILNQS